MNLIQSSDDLFATTTQMTLVHEPFGATCHKGNEISSGKNYYFPFSFNKTNCDHLIYKSQDTHKVFKNIKLKRFNTEIWVKCLSLCHKFQIEFTPSIRLNASKSDFLQMLWVFLRVSFRNKSLNMCFTYLI